MKKVVGFPRLNKVGDILKKKDSLLIVVLFSLFLVGCNETGTVDTFTSKEPDAAEALRLNNQADIFQWEGNIFQTEIEWIDELEMNEDLFIGNIMPLKLRILKMVQLTIYRLAQRFIQQKNVMIFLS